MATMVKVKLMRSHEHGGNEYPKDTVLTLTPDRANRLIELGYAVKQVSEDDFAPAPKAEAAKK